MVTNRARRVAFMAIALLCCLIPLPTLAALQAYVDRNPVPQDESFTLTLESNGDVDGSPDFSPLRQDFDIGQQGKQSSMEVVNGSVTRKTQWQVSLMPKRSGQLQIPSIGVGGQFSRPLTITITPASQGQSAQPGADLYLEVSAEPHTAYIQQQLIYTVRLYHAVSLASGATLSEPAFPRGNAVMERLGKDKEYSTLRNGVRYDVVERRYAIYPQKSGDLNIAPLVFDGDIVRDAGGFFSFDPFNQSTRHKRLRSQAVDIQVKPIPADFHGSRWLPAHSLQLMETWSPDPPKFVVGQPVTRTVAVMAEGLTAAQLPVPGTPAIDALKQYPDQPALKDTKDSSGVTGLVTEKIAFIPTRPGRIELPAVNIAWWNTTADRMETASLPAHSFNVAPAPASASAAPPPAPVADAPRTSPDAMRTVPLPSPQFPQAKVADGRWAWIALMLGIGWLTTIVAWWRNARRRASRVEPVRTEESSLRELERALKAGCHANDAAQVKNALLAWARSRWPRHPPTSVTAFARRCSAQLSEALIELDHALYAGSASTWHGDRLWQQFAGNKPANDAPKNDNASELEPLYPGS